jgi:hypothetical protein
MNTFYEMAVAAQTSYYLPPGYQAKRTCGTLLLHRPDGSVAVALYGQRAIGEIIEVRVRRQSPEGAL